jgi:hypothetical protein
MAKLGIAAGDNYHFFVATRAHIFGPAAPRCILFGRICNLFDL